MWVAAGEYDIIRNGGSEENRELLTTVFLYIQSSSGGGVDNRFGLSNEQKHCFVDGRTIVA